MRGTRLVAACSPLFIAILACGTSGQGGREPEPEFDTRMHAVATYQGRHLLRCTDFLYRVPAGLSFDTETHAMGLTPGTDKSFISQPCGSQFTNADRALASCRVPQTVPVGTPSGPVPVDYDIEEHYHSLAELLDDRLMRACTQSGGRWTRE